MRQPKESVSIFDAVKRFQACRSKLDSLGDEIEMVREKELPGIEDLVAQFSVLRITANEASRRFDMAPDQASAEVMLNSRDLKRIRNLEILVQDFAEVVAAAREELAA